MVGARLGEKFPIVQGMDMPSLMNFFFDAANTNAQMPRAFRIQRLSSWPEYAHDWLSYADAETRVRFQPSTKAVTAWAQAIFLSRELPEDDRRAIWLAAHSQVNRDRGPRWSRIARLLQCDYRTAKRKFEVALMDLYYRI